MTRRVSWSAVSLLLAPCGAWALGLGDIELRSALNEPLDANIRLVSATPAELADLRVGLAAPELFDTYGLDRPGFLGRIAFNITRDELGRDVVRLSSTEAITEPFVTVLVEATWNRGRLLREYTVFLDPPVLLPQEPVAETVQPPAARTPQPSTPAAVIERPPAAEPAPRAAPTTMPAPATTAGGDRPGTYGPVQRGETLWGIASRYRPPGVSTNQMMVAMYRANPAAFQGNMNVLLQGTRLDIPEAAVFNGLVATEATQEVIRQAAAWQGEDATQQARLRLVAPEAEGSAPATGAGTAATAALENELEDVRGELTEAQRLLALRDAELSNLQTQLSEARAAAGMAAGETAEESAVEEPVTVAPGVDLEAEEIFADDETEPLADEAEATQANEAVEAPPAAVPPRASTQVVSAAEEPSLVSRILGWLTMPLVWMIAGLAALVGAGAWYLRSRQADSEELTGRWEALEAEVEDSESREATDRMRKQIRDEDQTFVVEEQHTQELEQPSIDRDESWQETPAAKRKPEVESLLDLDLDLDLDEDLSAASARSRLPEEEPASDPAASGRFSPSDQTLSSSTVINLDQADPIAEADFHMAYGLYDQAAELVSRALEADPDNRALRLKLLEVYFVWGNRESFLETAQFLRTAIGGGSDPDWDKVVIMGKQICPDEALFADATAAADSVDLDLAAGDSPALDLAFDEGDSAGVDLDLGSDDDVSLELEATGNERAGGDVLDIGEDTELGDDLDIGERTAAGLEEAFREPASDASAKTSPNLDIDDAQKTQETPTVESEELDFDTLESPTVELGSADSPTVEAFGPDSPTMESPHLHGDADKSSELPTVEQPRLEPGGAASGDETAEIDLNDLGLDVDDLVELGEDAEDGGDDLGDDADVDVLSATGVTQVLSGSDDESDDDDTVFAKTAVLSPADDDADDNADDTGATARFQAPEVPASSRSGNSSGLDLDLDELTAALDGGDTVEQPGASQAFGADIFGEDSDTGIDLDIGSEDPTGKEHRPPLSDQTLTEVGTKLDLARAYIDMGDPEGARSILEEVLDEGDSTQQLEAKGLIDAL